jgi:hypothetical protein
MDPDVGPGTRIVPIRFGLEISWNIHYKIGASPQYSITPYGGQKHIFSKLTSDLP